jgi:putative ATP-dependent endonuclease of OLD family
MRISKIIVSNYRSLKNIELQDIGDLTVLIGTNSSGKSNILEAIFVFFNEFEPSIERNVGTIDDYVWFDRDSSVPVELKFTFEVDKDELSRILPAEISDQLTVGDKNTVEITRDIQGKPQASMWLTREVKVNDEILIRDRKFVFKRKKEVVEEVSPKKPPTDLSGTVLQNISHEIKGIFKLISAARNAPSTPTGISMRSTYLQPSVLTDLTNLGQTIGRPRQEEIKWIDIDQNVRKACRNVDDMRIMGSRVAIREKESDMYFPIEATGGGYQEVAGLICQLFKEGNVIIGIEEPELHLHPELARQFFSVIKELSSKNQIFVTTHSTVFVDQVDLKNTWVVRKDRKETKVFRVKGSAELENILHELGHRPSDLFYANGVMFVEGFTEKVVFPIWSKTIGVDFDDLGISLIPVRGKSSGKYHLTVWTEATENVGIPYYFVLDKDAHKEAEQLRNKLIEEENLFLLRKGAIEEYYPNDRITDALKKEYGIELTDEEKKFPSPKEKSIENLIKAKGKDTTGWKIAIGRIVAESMPLNEIDDEIRRILERTGTRLRQNIH